MRPQRTLLSIILKAGFELVFLLFFVEKSYCSSKSSSPYSTTSSPSDILEAIRYSPLPPTVFSPSGRLHNVEKNAKKASEDNASSSLVFALRCNSGDIVVVCTSPSSPLAYHHHDDDSADNGNEAEEDCSEDEFSAPLLFYQNHINGKNNDGNNRNEEIGSNYHVARPAQASLSSQPLSILSSNLIAATGGDAIDATILLRRIQDVALNLHRFQNGGVMMDMADSQQGRVSRGGTCSVQSASLARRIADSIQIPTQNVAGRSGKMLASSALIIGTDEPKIVNSRNYGKTANHNNHIWRIDPTGQFWNCDAAAIGRAAGVTEATLMRKIATWKKKQKSTTAPNDNNDTNDDQGDAYEKEDYSHIEDVISNLSNADVRNYLERLSSNEALSIACQCITDAIKRMHMSSNKSISQLHQDFQLQGIVLHSFSPSNRNTIDQSGGDKWERRCSPIIEFVSSNELQRIISKSAT